MATKTATAPKTATSADVASVTILAAMRDTSATIQGHALTILRLFADDMAAGKLSVNGAKATIAKASEDGCAIPEIRAGHAQHFVLMATLSRLDGAPVKLATLYTLADRLVRSAKKVDGQSKSESARSAADKALARKAKFATLDKNTPKQTAPKPPKARKSETTARSGESSAPDDTAERINDLAKWLRSASFDALTADIQDALMALSVIWEIRSAELAE